MSKNRLSSFRGLGAGLGSRASLALGALLCGSLVFSLGGCSNEPMPNNYGPMPSNAEEQAIKALKDKFYIDQNCAVYQKIVTFTCESGVVQIMCKDTAGNTKTAFYMKDPGKVDGWYSEKDIDDQIAAAEAQLMALQMKKAAFTPAHSPGYQCTAL